MTNTVSASSMPAGVTVLPDVGFDLGLFHQQAGRSKPLHVEQSIMSLGASD